MKCRLPAGINLLEISFEKKCMYIVAQQYDGWIQTTPTPE